MCIFLIISSCNTAQDVEDVSDVEFETASDELMKIMTKNGKMKMENLTKSVMKKTGVMLKNERKQLMKKTRQVKVYH